MAKYGFSKYLFYECLFEHRFALRFHKLGADTDTNDVLMKKWLTMSLNTIAIVVAAECSGKF